MDSNPQYKIETICSIFLDIWVLLSKLRLPYLIYVVLTHKLSLNFMSCNLLKILFSQTEAELRSLENSAQIFNALSDIPGGIDDVPCLFTVSGSGILVCPLHMLGRKGSRNKSDLKILSPALIG